MYFRTQGFAQTLEILRHHQLHDSPLPRCTHFATPIVEGPAPPAASVFPVRLGKKDSSVGRRPLFGRQDFNKFLASIKRLNNQQQSREDGRET